MDIKKISLFLIIIYIGYYLITILLDYLKQTKLDVSRAGIGESRMIDLEQTKPKHENEEPVAVARTAVFNKKSSVIMPKASGNIQIENIIGIHFIDDNELVGMADDLDFFEQATYSVEEYITNSNGGK